MVRILIVDDEPEIARSLRRVLRGAYEVEVADNGQDALERLDGFRPEVVISDLRMPHMSGTELLAEVQRRLPHSLRLILSGSADLGDRAVADPAGRVSRFLKKPWKNEELLEALAELLEERELAKQLAEGAASAVVDESAQLASFETAS